MAVLITGTTSGIGKEFTKIFAKEKNDLVLVSKNKERLEEQKQELEKEYKVKVKIIPKDLSQENVGQEILNEIQKENIEIDILINNAGFGICGKYVDIDWKTQKDLAVVNMITPMELSHIFAKEMIKKGKGKILNVASIAAYQAGPYMAMYYSSKAFLLSFSESLAKELENTGVTVTALCPGPTSTNFDKTAKIVKSPMFTKMARTSAEYVAKKGYEALLKNKVICIPGIPNKLVAFSTRLGSKKLSRNIAAYINTGKM